MVRTLLPLKYIKIWYFLKYFEEAMIIVFLLNIFYLFCEEMDIHILGRNSFSHYSRLLEPRQQNNVIHLSSDFVN